jgi:D-glycero-D-manno-heptose 1,7-bisphosphate phosphatase
MNEKRAIILDRDGVLIEDKNYVYRIEDFELLPGVIEGLRMFSKNYLLFIVTNQSGIGKGYYTVEDFNVFNNHLIKILSQNRIKIEKTFFCPHLKDENCACRKPNQKFINEIRNGWNVDLKKSWMIGDHPSDILFGNYGGSSTIFLTTGHGKEHLNDLNRIKTKPTFICNVLFQLGKRLSNFLLN